MMLKPTYSSIVVLSLIAALGSLDSIRGPRLADDPEEHIQQIAVIPFRETDPKPGAPALGDEMADAVVNSLCEVKGLSVLPEELIHQQALSNGAPDAMMKPADALIVAKKLGADTLITGSYKRSGGSLQVEWTVTDVQTGQRQEDKTNSAKVDYQKGYVGLLHELPDRLRKLLKPGEPPVTVPKQSVSQGDSASVEAHQLYSAGLRNEKTGTETGLTAAKASFQSAVDKDPGFGLAYAAKCDTEVQLARLKLHGNKDADIAQERADAVADALRAVKQSPYSGGAHLQMCRALSLSGDFVNAAMAARVAAQLWPASGSVFVDLGRALSKGGIADGPELQHAMRMSPALVLLVQELPKVTVVNAGTSQLKLTFAQAPDHVAATVTVPAGETRLVGLVAGRYSVTTTGDGTTKSDTQDFGPGTVYAIDGRTLVAATPGQADPKRLTPKEDPFGKYLQAPTKKNLKADSQMVYIWGGLFTMGDESQKDNKPHHVNVTTFWIGQTPVTIKQFRLFTDAPDGYQLAFSHPFDWEKNKPSFGWLGDNHPMVNVDWYEARAYCKWAGGNLPTEAQWEHAARGLGYPTYPWGNEWDPARVQWSARTTAPVDAHSTGPNSGASPYGCYDMLGNVAQWCGDGYQPDLSTLLDNPLGDGPTAVIRGRSWRDSDKTLFPVASRAYVDPKTKTRYTRETRLETVGFRYVCPDVP